MLILASASPRRQELLRHAGIAFDVQPTEVPETPREGESPQACAERLAREKALAVFRQRPNDQVLGADTIVVVDGVILGKPRDEADATHMLRLLSGKTHSVITGVCLVGNRSLQGPQPSEICGHVGLPEAAPFPATPERIPSYQDVRSETTLVTFAALSDQEIRSYIASGEPMDKAGAYAIQGIASRWISCIEGDYSNVVGLPVSLVYRMLRAHSIPIDV